jgi:DNA topoisomerase-3
MNNSKSDIISTFPSAPHKLVIAEKPSVAQSIAKVLGATSRKDGYLEGNNYIVSWCVGHLVGLADASSYDERYAKWRYDDLPIVPEEWLFEVPKDKAQQFKVLHDLMKDKRVTELVCATDAGREGELIFRLVYNKAGCTKPFKRLWTSSLEDGAIREGFNHLRDGSDYDKLYEAALSRSKADWIVGINGTRLFTTLYKKKLVVGRVQTPTLAMLVEREGKITTFHKEKYFNIHVEKDGLTADMEKIKTEEEAKTIATACDKKQAVVSSVRKETKTVNPPKLYDLTTLQREANRYFSFTAQQTLDLVQSLYEKKLLTYPRTDSQFITDDMEGTARQVIGIICRKVSIFDGLSHDPDIKRITNNAKVTDHHAIIPTVQLEKQDISELPESEQKIIRLVAMRLLSSTGEKHIYDETSVTLSCEGYDFKTKGKTVVQDGWKAIEQHFKDSLKTKDKEEPEKVLPAVNENDILSPVAASVTEHYTTPPKPYTEDTLLSAMETAGNEEFDDDTEKKGLGTPATRAGIIEKLVKSGFIERKGKSLVPTKDGNNLVCVLPEQITSPTMTAEWENTLMQIERGNAAADTFLKGIVQMTGDLVKTYPFLSDAEANRFESGKEVIGKCPRCGSPVYVGKGNYYCSSKECSFCMWEDNKFFASKKKKLTKKIASELLDKGWCRVKGLYTPKKPQLYDAIIKLDDTGGKYVSFKMEFEK